MNSLAASPLAMPAGTDPAKAKPTWTEPPGSTGLRRGDTYEARTVVGRDGRAVQVQRGFPSASPPVSGICRSGLAWLLTSS